MRALQAVFYSNPDRYPPLINQARLFAENGYHYDLLYRAAGEQKSRYPPSVQLRPVPSQGRKSWQAYLQFVVRTVRQSNPSAACVIAHDMHAFLPALLIARWRRLPLIYQIHELIDETTVLDTGGRVIYHFHKRFARQADLVIASDAGRAALLKQQLHLSAPVLVVANSPLRRAISAYHVRLQQDLQSRGHVYGKILLRQSNIGPSHALETTIRSLPLWANHQWAFVVIGPGREEYLKSLRQLAADLHVQNRFVVLPPVAYDDLFLYTPGAHAGHALYEPIDTNNRVSTTSSNKLMEYMAAGLPIIVSDRPALRSLVEMYQCGVCADEHSPESIAAAVNALFVDSQLARCLGENGRRAFEDVFCYERQFVPVLEYVRALSAQPST